MIGTVLVSCGFCMCKKWEGIANADGITGVNLPIRVVGDRTESVVSSWTF